MIMYLFIILNNIINNNIIINNNNNDDDEERRINKKNVNPTNISPQQQYPFSERHRLWHSLKLTLSTHRTYFGYMIKWTKFTDLWQQSNKHSER